MNRDKENRGYIPGGVIDFPCSDTWAQYYEQQGLTNPLVPNLLDLQRELRRLNSGRQDANQRTNHSQR